MDYAYYTHKTDFSVTVLKESSRVYFGSEFCEHLLPSSSALKRIMGKCGKLGKSLTLVTPYLTEKGVERTLKLIEILSEEAVSLDAEVILNDFGMIYALRSEYSVHKGVGRLLSRQERCPRLLLKKDEARRNDADKSAYSPEYLDLIQREYGIRRIEFDNMTQGIPVGLSESGMEISVYIPFVFLTLTTPRFCLYADGRWEGRCRKKCLERPYVNMISPRMPHPIILRGNAQFYINRELEASIEEKGVDRIIYEQEFK